MTNALKFRRWLAENESDACDAVRDTTLGLPLDVDYDALKTKALAGEVDWVPPAFVYLDGTCRCRCIDELLASLPNGRACGVAQLVNLPFGVRLGQVWRYSLSGRLTAVDPR